MRDKIVIVLPAYNAEKTLRRTLDEIPSAYRDHIILVDDASQDNTVSLAKSLGLTVFEHKVNKGYGGNQKTCYTEALKMGATIVVMLHPDHQYDATIIPELIAPIRDEDADAVFGSRMLGYHPMGGGMPWWKYAANVVLTAIANLAFGRYLTEIHSGFRAYSRKYLTTVPFMLNSDGFVFDTEIIAQGMAAGLRFQEVPIATRYFEEASSIKFGRSILYGLGVIRTLLNYVLHQKRIWRSRKLQPFVKHESFSN
jgi:glycosyltransferase involved in cell wall biosynthesis